MKSSVSEGTERNENAPWREQTIFFFVKGRSVVLVLALLYVSESLVHITGSALLLVKMMISNILRNLKFEISFVALSFVFDLIFLFSFHTLFL